MTLSTRRALIALAIEEIADTPPAVDPAAATANIEPSTTVVASDPVIDPAAPVVDPVAPAAAPAVPTEPAAATPGVDTGATAPVVDENLAGAELDAGEDELTEDGEALDDDFAESGELVEGATALDNVAASVDASVEEGGLTPAAAQAVDIAVESICNRLGIKRSKTLAAETFTSVADRKRVTKAAAESIGETAGKIWTAIVEFLKKSIAFVKDFASKAFSQTEKLQKAAEAAKNTFKQAAGAVVGNIPAGMFGRNLTYNGKFSPQGVIEGLEALRAHAIVTLDALEAFGLGVQEVADKMPHVETTQKIQCGFTSIFAHHDGRVHTSASFLGGGSYSVTFNRPVEASELRDLDIQTLAHAKILMNPSLEQYSEQTIPTATKEQCIRIFDNTAMLTRDINSRQGAVLKSIRTLEATVAKINAKMTNDVGSKMNSTWTGFFHSATAIMVKLMTGMVREDLRAGHNAFHYAAACVKKTE